MRQYTYFLLKQKRSSKDVVQQSIKLNLWVPDVLARDSKGLIVKSVPDRRVCSCDYQFTGSDHSRKPWNRFPSSNLSRSVDSPKDEDLFDYYLDSSANKSQRKARKLESLKVIKR